MFERHVVPSDHPGYAIQVTTEQRPGGSWAVVAVVLHETPNGRSVTQVPVPAMDYPTQVEAREAGVHAASRWISENTPHEDSEPSHAA